MHHLNERLAISCALFAILLHSFDKRKLAALVACVGIASLCLCAPVHIHIPPTNRRHRPSNSFELFDNTTGSDHIVGPTEQAMTDEGQAMTEEEQAMTNEQAAMDEQAMPDEEAVTDNSGNAMDPKDEPNVQQATPNVGMRIVSAQSNKKLQVVYDPEERYGDFIADHSGPPAYVGRWRAAGAAQWNRVSPPPIAPNPLPFVGRDRLHRIEPVKTNQSYNSRTGRLSRYAWLT